MGGGGSLLDSFLVRLGFMGKEQRRERERLINQRGKGREGGKKVSH